jgi:hypothetical protein
MGLALDPHSIATAGLSVPRYLAGWVGMLAVLLPLSASAWLLRRALLPRWSGPPARLVEAVVALGALITTAEVLGALGLLEAGPVVVGSVLAAAVLAGVAAWARGRVAVPAAGLTPGARPDRASLVAAAVGISVVTAQWATHVAKAWDKGMTQPDTLWYHMPFAARFVQEGSFTGLGGIGHAVARYYPFNAQVVHSLAILPFGRDVLSPLVNIGWAALALLAGWCIGRRAGVAPLSCLGVAAVLTLPMLAGTHPGQASNDVVCAALVLAAVALLLEGREAPAPAAVAGVAAGLALGTKLTVAAPLLVLSVAVVIVAVRARRPSTALAWAAAMVASGSFWYVRNWVRADNPLPWFDIELGPVRFPVRAAEDSPSFASSLFDLDAWRLTHFWGFTLGFGRWWQLVFALGIGAAILLLVRGRGVLQKACGVAVLAGGLQWALSPLTGGLSTPYGLRYLSPVLMIGLALLPVTLVSARAMWRHGATALVLVLMAAATTSKHIEPVSGWPRDYLLPGILAGGAVLAGVLLVRRVGTSALWPVAAGGLALAVAGGFSLQRHYLDNRYVDAGLDIDRTYAFFRDVRDARVGVFGAEELYPMFGLDLSNEVRQITGADLCRRWPSVVAADYDYVALTQQGILAPESLQDEVLQRDPAATEVEREEGGVVFRIDGRLDPRGCD